MKFNMLCSFLTNALWIVIGLAILALLILCIKSKLARVVSFSVLAIATVFTIFATGAISCYFTVQYFTSQGGTFGNATEGTHNTISVFYNGDRTFTFYKLGFSSSGIANEYTSTVIFEEKSMLVDRTDTFFLNGRECDIKDYSIDFLQSTMKMAFYDKDNNVAFEDVLIISLWTYDDSMKLQLTTNGGDRAVKYWTRYLTKNKFVLSIDKASKIPSFDEISKDTATSTNNKLKFFLLVDEDASNINGVVINYVNTRTQKSFNKWLSNKNGNTFTVYDLVWGDYKIFVDKQNGFIIKVNGQEEYTTELSFDNTENVTITVLVDPNYTQPVDPISYSLTLNINFDASCKKTDAFQGKISVNIYDLNNKAVYTYAFDMIPNTNVSKVLKGLTPSKYRVAITAPSMHIGYLENDFIRYDYDINDDNPNVVVNCLIKKTMDDAPVVSN